MRMISRIPFPKPLNDQPVGSLLPGKGSGIIGRRRPLSEMPGNILF